MANKKVQIQIDTKATGNGAKQATDDLKKLGTTADQVATKASGAAAGASRAASGRAAQVGFQVQDIAVQAQMGVAATTILAQQGSQLLGAFGPTGAILGGVLAIGSAAAGVFLKMGEDVESVEEKAERLKDSLDFVRENAEKLNSERIDMGRKAIEESIRLAELLRQGFDNVKKAEQEASDNALHNAEKLRLIQVEIRRLKGEEVDEVEEVTKKAEYQAAAAEQARQKEIRAQEEIRQAAIQRQQDAQDLLDASAHQLITEQSNLDLRIEQLQALRDQRAELEKIAQQRDMTADAFSESGMTNALTPEAYAARQQLQDTPFDAQIQQLQGQIDDLAKQTAGPLYKSVTDAAGSLRDAMATLPSVLAETQTKVEEINKSANLEQLSISIEEQTAIAKANAVEVNEIIKDFVPATTDQAAALAIIKQKTADLKITADEAPIVAQNLVLIQSALTTSNGESIKSFQAIIQALTTVTTQLNTVTRDTKRIEASIIR